MKHVLITGRGTSGSWAIRGQQLGKAIGATVIPNAVEVNGFRLAVIVKRVRLGSLQRLQAHKLPLVWDIVDAWPQPAGNEWDRQTCLAWLRSEAKALHPCALVVSTQVMQEDCKEFNLPTLVLPHHARPNMRVNPIREKVAKIGYEGGEQYLGTWSALLQSECGRRGWGFVLNPPELADLDIVVAFRDVRGYAARHWKSNVKLANAQGSGTPCIMNKEAGYLETERGGVMWVDDISTLSIAFDVMDRLEVRRNASRELLASQPRLEDVAQTYKTWLHAIG